MVDESKSSLSNASSYEEMAEFWDTHSLADYHDQTYEVDMTFDPSAHSSYISIETELMTELRQIARNRRISTQTLVNIWLRERVDKLHVSPS